MKNYITNKNTQALADYQMMIQPSNQYTESDRQADKDRMDKRYQAIVSLFRQNPLYEKAIKNESNIAGYLMQDSDSQQRYGLDGKAYLNELHVGYWLDTLALAIDAGDWSLIADLIRGEFDFTRLCDYSGKED